jgi:hypothetical protein
MSSNSKDVDTKSKAMAEGRKECSYSRQSIAAEVNAAAKSLPNFLNYSKQYRAEKVKDNSGWKVRPENKGILK